MCWKGFGTGLILAFSPAFMRYPHIVWSQQAIGTRWADTGGSCGDANCTIKAPHRNAKRALVLFTCLHRTAVVNTAIKEQQNLNLYETQD